MTDDIETQDEMVLAAEYTLGLLSPAEHDAFEEVLAVDPALRAQYAAWAENFANLTDDVAPVDPPEDLKPRIMTALFGAAPKKSLFARLGLFGPVLAGVVGAFVVLTLLGQTDFLRDPAQTFVAELTDESQSFVVLASFDPATNALDLKRTAGGPREGRALEMWLIAGDNPPVSLGVWPRGQPNAILDIPADIAAQMAGGVLAVSDEPIGGSTTGAPTGDVLAAGQITVAG